MKEQIRKPFGDSENTRHLLPDTTDIIFTLTKVMMEASIMTWGQRLWQYEPKSAHVTLEWT